MKLWLTIIAGLVAGAAQADLVLQTGTQIVFPDGTTMESALESGLSLPDGHGGTNNTTTGADAYIGGGDNNTASADRATVGAGRGNNADGGYSTVGGGHYNTVYAFHSTIAGGYSNLVFDNGGAIGGGGNNQAGDGAGTLSDRPYATVAGGENNTAAGGHSSIGGGVNNQAPGFAAVVTGGLGNTAGGEYSSVAGGSTNTASGAFSTVGGGGSNQVSGQYSFIAGGNGNVVNGDQSFAGGYGAFVDAAHDNSFVWGDAEGGSSAGPETFNVWADGGIYLNGGVVHASDEALKTDFEPVDTSAILEKLSGLPITSWRFHEEPDNVRHVGPTAQAFSAAFGLGVDERYIGTVDADGVALAAIQGLNQRLETELAAKQRRIDELAAQNAALESRLAAIEQMLSR